MADRLTLIKGTIPVLVVKPQLSLSKLSKRLKKIDLGYHFSWLVFTKCYIFILQSQWCKMEINISQRLSNQLISRLPGRGSLTAGWMWWGVLVKILLGARSRNSDTSSSRGRLFINRRGSLGQECNVLEPDGNWKAVKIWSFFLKCLSLLLLSVCVYSLLCWVLQTFLLLFSVLTHHFHRAQMLAEDRVGRGCLLNQHCPLCPQSIFW